MLTIEAATRQAVDTSGLTQAHVHDIAAAEFQALEVRMNRMPRFDFTLGLGPAPEVIQQIDEDGEVTGTEIGRLIAGVSVAGSATVTIPITTFGKVRIGLQLAELGIDAAQIQAESAEDELRFQVFRAYRSLQWAGAANALIVSAESRLADAREELEFRLDDGDSSARTSLRQMTIFRTRIVELSGGVAGVQTAAEQAMRSVLGDTADAPLAPFDDGLPTDVPTSLAAALAAAGARTDMSLLDLAVAAEETELRLERRRHAPDAFLAATVEGIWTSSAPDTSGPAENNRFNDLSGGVYAGLRWRANPFQQRARVLRAREESLAMYDRRSAAIDAIEIDVANAWQETVSAFERLQAYHDARRAAEAWLTQRSFQFDQGLAGFDDLIEPLKAYYENAGGYLEALLDYQVKLANLALKTGSQNFAAWPPEVE